MKEYLLFFAAPLLCVLFLGSCSKKESKEIAPTGEAVRLSVIVGSVSEVEENPLVIPLKAGTNGEKGQDAIKNNLELSTSAKSTRLSVAKQILKNENKALTNKVINSGGVEVQLSVEEEVNTPLLKASSAMGKDNTFRLLLYKKSDGSFHSSTQFKVGTPGSIDVSQKETYTWYAYSYNDKGNVSDVVDRINPSIASAVDRDLLYAQGEVTVGTAPAGTVVNTPVIIDFKHMTSRVGIVINAQGMFAGLNSGKLQIDQSFFEVGTLNLKTGIVGGSAPATPGVVTGLASGKRYKTEMLDTAKIVAYFYTSSNAKTFTDFKVKLTDFDLKLDDGSNRVFNSLNSDFTFPTLTPVLGRGKLLKVDLIESALTIDGTKWARANLFWTGITYPATAVASATGAYVFRHFPDRRYKQKLDGEFWDYGTAKPGMVKPLGGSIPAVDPCAFVYPKGVWRMPTEAESLKLAKIANVPNGGGKTSAANGTTFGPDYIEYTATGTAAPYPSNRFRFSFNGFSSGGGVTAVNYVGEYGQFWNSSFFSDRNQGYFFNAGYMQFGFGALKFKNLDGVITSTQPSVTDAATGYVLLVRILSGGGGAINIRCVRSNTTIVVDPFIDETGAP